MYCKYCGKEIDDNSAYCGYCGARQDGNSPHSYSYVNSENVIWGVLSIVCAFFMPILGLIFGIIGLTTYKEPKNRKLCKVGIGIVIAEIVLIMISVIFYVLYIFGSML